MKTNKTAISILLVLVIILSLLFTGLGYPGFMLGVIKKDTPPAKTNPGTDNPILTGNSAAFSISPIEGITISAEENAFETDPNIKFSELEQYDETLKEIDREMAEDNEFILAAYELDAGLGPDDSIPGEYKVDIDLSKIGIPESLFPNLRAYRIDSNGNTFLYDTSLNGSILTATSKQNSVLILSTLLVGTATVCITKTVNKETAAESGHLKFDHVFEKDIFCSGGTAKLIWYPETTEQVTNAERVKQIEKNYLSDAEDRLQASVYEDAFETNSNAVLYRDRRGILKEAAAKLAQDEEYKELIEEISKSENIEMLIGMIKDAYRFLNDVEQIKMPKYQVRFYVRNLSRLGEATTGTLIKNPYIHIGFSKFRTEFPSERDMNDMRLTVIHELFHICQNQYRAWRKLDNPKYDEAIAVTLEWDAYNYLVREGYIDPESDIEHTEDTFFETLIIPMDSGTLGYTDDAIISEGYTYSRFVRMLREKTGNNVPAGPLMEAASYFSVPNISDSLANAFGLSEDEFEQYYRLFCRTNKAFFEARFRHFLEHPDDNKVILMNEHLSVDRGHHVTIKPASYTAYVRGFVPLDFGPYAVVFVPDENLSEVCPEFSTIALCSGAVKTSKLLFYPAESENEEETYPKTIMEMHGNAEHYALLAEDTGYTAYMIQAPANPEVEEKNGKLLITLPEKTAAMQDGVTTGYKVKITSSDGKVKEKYYSSVAAGTTRKFNMKKLTDVKEGEEVTFKVTLTEYIKAGNRYLEGPESGQESLLDARLAEEGALSGDITISMLWNSDDDMDLHLVTPEGEIFYMNKNVGDGHLDVDMQVTDIVPSPIENIYVNNPPSGHYKVIVDNYKDRTPDSDTRVMVRITIGGTRQEFNVTLGSRSTVYEFDYGTVSDDPGDEDLD